MEFLLQDIGRDIDINNITLPLVLKDKTLMAPGLWNNNFYSASEIHKGYENTDWDDASNVALYWDHLDGPNEGAKNWVGIVKNPHMSGDKLKGDLEIVNMDAARSLAYGAKFGISPKVGGMEVGQEMVDFSYGNFSVVDNPAVKLAWINNAEDRGTYIEDYEVVVPNAIECELGYKHFVNGNGDICRVKEEKKMEEQELAVWSSAEVNDLPDDSFLYIGPDGKKDEDGKTVPRSLRKLPYKNSDGEIDLPHLRNALSRLGQPKTDIPEEEKKSLITKAEGLLQKSKENKMTDKEENKKAEVLDEETKEEETPVETSEEKTETPKEDEKTEEEDTETKEESSEEKTEESTKETLEDEPEDPKKKKIPEPGDTAKMTEAEMLDIVSNSDWTDFVAAARKEHPDWGMEEIAAAFKKQKSSKMEEDVGKISTLSDKIQELSERIKELENKPKPKALKTLGAKLEPSEEDVSAKMMSYLKGVK